MLKSFLHRFLALGIASVMLFGLVALNIGSGRQILGRQVVMAIPASGPMTREEVGGGAENEGLTADEQGKLTETQKRGEKMSQTEGLTASEAASILVSSPSECASKTVEGKQQTPINCFFLEEPIGNDNLYLVTCIDGDCTTTSWHGGTYPTGDDKIVQAILSRDPDKPHEGSFGLLYSYLGLIYGYMSGLIVGIVVLFIVVGGVQMITSGGQQDKYDAGKKRITQALIGMVLWFLASLILYTINPTFFAF